jgi:hypothetical protein
MSESPKNIAASQRSKKQQPFDAITPKPTFKVEEKTGQGIFMNTNDSPKRGGLQGSQMSNKP